MAEQSRHDTMKITAECVPCLMKRMLFQTRLVECDGAEVMGRCLRAFSDSYSPEMKSVDVASLVHAECYRAIGNDDPYLGLKIRSDEIASGLLPDAERMVSSSEDPFRAALAVSVAGNIMDFGSGIAIDDPDAFVGMFGDLVGQGFGLDHSGRLRELLDEDGPVVYMFDNCGECQMDKVLIRMLRSMGKEVIGVVRGEPILNDVSVRDVERCGLAAEVDSIRDSGAFYVGLDTEHIPSALREDMGRACVTIAKGMGNYESLSDESLPSPVAHILRAKCGPVARSIGVPVGTNVVLVRERDARRHLFYYRCAYGMTTMGRNELINTTRAILAKAGFDVSSALTMRGICFDVVARLDEKVLILKILSNIDALSKESADEMKTLADALNAVPLLIGERSSSGGLEPGIVYSRFNISIVSNETLADLLLDDAPPFIFAAPGGLYVKLDSEMLKAVREERGISLGSLAETAGVSRRTIQMYESGMGAMIDAALRIEEYLGLPVIDPIDPFTFRSEDRAMEHREIPSLDSYALRQLSSLGFTVSPVSKSPFEAVASDSSAIMLTGISPDDERVVQRAIVASDISKIMGRFSVIIVEKKRDRDSIDTTAVVSEDELKRIEEPTELTDLVASRGIRR